MRLEGKGSSRLLQLIREAGKNFEVSIELATVISPPPDLQIELDKTGIKLNKEDLIVAEHLLEHEREVESVNMEDAGDPSHSHEINSLTLKSKLNNNDRVIAAGINDFQTYIILDRAVIM